MRELEMKKHICQNQNNPKTNENMQDLTYAYLF